MFCSPLLYTKSPTAPLAVLYRHSHVYQDPRITGLFVQQGSFQTKILIKVVQAQFQLVGKALGLPSKFHVSDSQEVYTGGLLGDKWTQVLLDA